MSIRTVHVSPITPALGGNGLAMRTSMFSQAAGELGETLVLVIDNFEGEVAGHGFANVQVQGVEARQRLDTRLALIRRNRAGAGGADMLRQYGKPSTSGILSAPVMRDVVEQLSRHQPDLCILSRAHLLPLLPHIRAALPGLPIVVDLDDDDAGLHIAYAHRAAADADPIEKDWHLAEADVTDRQIVSAVPDVSRFFCASQQVLDGIQGRLGLEKASVVANAVTLPGASPARKAPDPLLLFVGNLSYQPNIDGLEWFFAHVWPVLEVRLPELKVCVAGSLPADRVQAMCKRDRVVLVSNPPDLGPFYVRAAAAIVPLRFGSGSRIKILEAAMYGTPVVSTATGAQGLGLDGEQHGFLTPDDPEAFARACIACVSNPLDAERRASNMQAHVAAHHSREAVVRQIKEMLRQGL